MGLLALHTLQDVPTFVSTTLIVSAQRQGKLSLNLNRIQKVFCIPTFFHPLK